MTNRPAKAATHVVGSAAELPPGTHKIVNVMNVEIGIYNVGGRFLAVQNSCPHQYGPACLGPVGGEMISRREDGWKFKFEREGEILTCPWHGMEFDLVTGQCLSLKSKSLRTFDVSVVNGELHLSIGRRREASAAKGLPNSDSATSLNGEGADTV